MKLELFKKGCFSCVSMIFSGKKFPEFRRGHSGFPPEHPGKLEQIAVTALRPHFLDAQIAVPQQIPGTFHPAAQLKLDGRHSEMFPEAGQKRRD